MATIELAQLSNHLDPSDVEATCAAVLSESGEALVPPAEDDSEILDSNIDDDIFTDFRDRLEANDLDADVYVPQEFEDLLEVGSLRVASAHALRVVLDSLREDFFVEDDRDGEFEEDEADDDFDREELTESDDASGYYEDEHDGIEVKDEQLRGVWRAVFRATRESIERNMPLFLRQ